MTETYKIHCIQIMFCCPLQPYQNRTKQNRTEQSRTVSFPYTGFSIFAFYKVLEKIYFWIIISESGESVIASHFLHYKPGWTQRTFQFRQKITEFIWVFQLSARERERGSSLPHCIRIYLRGVKIWKSKLSLCPPLPFLWVENPIPWTVKRRVLS